MTRVRTSVERVKVLVVEKGDAADVARAFQSAEQAQVDLEQGKRRRNKLRRRVKGLKAELEATAKLLEEAQRARDQALSERGTLQKVVGRCYELAVDTRRKLHLTNVNSAFTEVELRQHLRPSGKLLATIVVPERAQFHGFAAAGRHWNTGVTTEEVTIEQYLRIQEQQQKKLPIAITLGLIPLPPPEEVKAHRHNLPPDALKDQVELLCSDMDRIDKRALALLERAEKDAAKTLQAEKDAASLRTSLTASNRESTSYWRQLKEREQDLQQKTARYEEAVRYIKTLRESQRLATERVRGLMRGPWRTVVGLLPRLGEVLFLLRGGREPEPVGALTRRDEHG